MLFLRRAQVQLNFPEYLWYVYVYTGFPEQCKILSLINPLNPSRACAYVPRANETFWRKWRLNWGLEELSVYLRRLCLLQVAFIWKQIGPATRFCRRLRAILPMVEDTVAPFSRYRSALPWRVSHRGTDRFRTNFLTFKVRRLLPDRFRLKREGLSKFR